MTAGPPQAHKAICRSGEQSSRFSRHCGVNGILKYRIISQRRDTVSQQGCLRPLCKPRHYTAITWNLLCCTVLAATLCCSFYLPPVQALREKLSLQHHQFEVVFSRGREEQIITSAWVWNFVKSEKITQSISSGLILSRTGRNVTPGWRTGGEEFEGCRHLSGGSKKKCGALMHCGASSAALGSGLKVKMS